MRKLRLFEVQSRGLQKLMKDAEGVERAESSFLFDEKCLIGVNTLEGISEGEEMKSRLHDALSR